MLILKLRSCLEIKYTNHLVYALDNKISIHSYHKCVSSEVNTATRSEWTNKNKKEEIKKDASKIVGM